ncbi:MAG: class I SAM-dependent methyltransferase [Sandaracinaceae bacterium]|nr:class I SAM-dependent methyltransferase [Sandaracinaceae bacterium]
MAKRKHRFTAKNADRHTLYQLSVQAPEHEVELLSRMYKRHTGKRALTLREDFCGTGLLCCAWADSKKDRAATGLDIDAPTLAWGHANNLTRLSAEAQSRVTLLEQNVLQPTPKKHDVICAFNYSYQTFKTRELLLQYFRAVHRSLASDGIFVLDLLGGWESRQTLKEPRAVGESKREGFTYVWHQASFDPITHHFLAHIHFHFHDGTKLKKAFTYDWRLYTIPEIKELLTEAGFVGLDVYWEGDDGEGGGNGEFERVETIHDDPGWNTYIVAKKQPPTAGSKDAARAARAR